MADSMDPQTEEGQADTPNFNSRPFVTFREPVAEISSLLSEMYLNEQEDSDTDEDVNTTGAGIMDSSGVQNIKDAIKGLQDRVDSLEGDFRASLESAVNREQSLRDYVDQRFAEVELFLKTSLKQLEQGVVECMLRRDAQWKRELSKLKRTSTPTSQTSFFYPPSNVSDIMAQTAGNVSGTPSLYAKHAKV